MADQLPPAEFIDGYLAEAEEHLSIARSGLVAIDEAQKKDGRSPGAVRNVFRSVHTLKGLSGMIGAEPIVDLAHEMETLLRSADKAGGKVPTRAIDEILKGLQAIEERVACLSRGQVIPAAPRALLEALASIQIDASEERPSGTLSLEPALLAKLSLAEQEQLLQGLAQGRRAVRVDFVPSPERSAQGFNITRVREQMAKLGELVKVIPLTLRDGEGSRGKVAFALLVVAGPGASDRVIAEAAGTVAEDVRPIQEIGQAEPEEAELPKEARAPTVERRERNFVRVEVSRLDDALERLSALVVTRSRLERAAAALNAGGSVRDLLTIIAENGRQLRDLRAAIMQARMVPLSEILERAPLVVRGLTRTSRKLVHLSIDAGSSELDKSVADRLFPAIVHLLRNAVDHALELPEERRAKGKPEEGRLQISCAERSGSQLALEIRDDGRGIDREEVARRAGVPVPKDDAELLALIARPGLSTLDRATHASGRGLGMEIVKRIVVDQLGGKLRLETVRDQGTTFTMTVPLSVSVLDVFTFICSGRKLAVPLSSVEALTEIENGAVLAAPQPERRLHEVRLLKHRGASVPLYCLSSLLGFAKAERSSSKAILMRRDSDLLAFEVDSMIGRQEVVVRPLADPLVSVEGITGSTDLGDGQPTLVLDLLLLAQRGSRSEAAFGRQAKSV